MPTPTPEPPLPAATPPPLRAAEPRSPRPGAGSQPHQNERDVVVVTRTVVWMQGSLLLLLALIGFVSGYFVARSYGPPSARVPQPSFITGSVRYQRADESLTPDAGAVVLLLPVEGVPDRMSKLAVFGLRPQDVEAGPSDSTAETLRAIGGDMCRATGEGFYHLRVRDSGDYFVLFLSAHLERTGDQPLDRQMLAELGRYVDRANELVAGSALVWERMTINRDLQINQVIR